MMSPSNRPGSSPLTTKWHWLAGAAAGLCALGLAMPLMAGRAPTSLLPPGFGDAPPEESEPAAQQPDQSPTPGTPASQRPPLQLDLSEYGGTEPAIASNATEEELSPEELAEQQYKYDLPNGARRSLDRIGPLTPATGGFAPDAFGNQSGRFLAALMRETRAPLVSRWGSILLRRVLLSATDTPSDIDGADWAAERAWLLIRMGEADPARMIVQSVDADNFSKRLFAVAMQSYLATADPIGLCPLQQRARTISKSSGWQMAEAICSSFEAEQGRASAILNQTERSGKVRGIDYRLAEKIVGAGPNGRRSVKIEWDGVDRLTAWRFGLATASNVEIPAPLMSAAGSHVRAWQARAPMLSLAARRPAVEDAARLGVLSSAALIDYYSQLDQHDDVSADVQARANAIRLAYSAPTPAARIAAMREIWTDDADQQLLANLVLSRSAAALPLSEVGGEDLSRLIASMMSAGYDISAARWAPAKAALDDSEGVDAWAMLAVGAPRPVVAIETDRLKNYIAADGQKGEMFLAGLAGLGRLGEEELRSALADAGMAVQPRSKWERAIDLAARKREKGTVALLAAVGMQVSGWSKMPPSHLYHIVSALHRAGLDAEARMIAAEAIMRS